MSSHYDTLGIDRSAAHDDVRRAYHDAARRWHPDRFVGESSEAQERAADSMRAVNEAWRVLGDAERRREYDRVAREGRTIRIDPRLIDPEILEARRNAQFEQTETSHNVMLRVFPVLAMLVLLVGIFVFTAYANTRGGSGPTTVPGPDIGVDAGACVRILPGPQLLAVPCDGLNDGRVIGAYEPGGSCPATTLREVALANGITVCLG